MFKKWTDMNVGDVYCWWDHQVYERGVTSVGPPATLFEEQGA